MKILLVDDHEIVRRGLKQLLTGIFPQAGFDEAAGIPAARALLTTECWDLVLLDINLPGGSGLDLLGELRRHCPQTPVLILSAYPEEEFARRAFKLGAAGYLTKASVTDEMLTAVRRVLAGGRYVSAVFAEQMVAELGQPQPGERHELLSERELGVLRLVASGRTIKEIAAEYSLSEKTIATYRERVAKKIQLSTNVELTRYALKHKLVE